MSKIYLYVSIFSFISQVDPMNLLFFVGHWSLLVKGAFFFINFGAHY
jgi:hypothetical protein